jgi:hypothetical protein
MLHGPHLHPDGHTLIIPSAYYDPLLSHLWKTHDFRYNSRPKNWTRDTRHPHNGHHYTPTAWLKAATTHYWNAWTPTLSKTCPTCHTTFLPHNPYEIQCPR